MVRITWRRTFDVARTAEFGVVVQIDTPAVAVVQIARTRRLAFAVVTYFARRRLARIPNATAVFRVRLDIDAPIGCTRLRTETVRRRTNASSFLTHTARRTRIAAYAAVRFRFCHAVAGTANVRVLAPVRFAIRAVIALLGR